MPAIVITRPKEWINRRRKYQIHLDGKPLGTIRNDEILQFEIPEGGHVLTARIDWCSSNEYSFQLGRGETRYLKLTAFKEASWLMPVATVLGIGGLLAMNLLHNDYFLFAVAIPLLPLLYFYTLGRKSYLLIAENIH